MAIVRLQTIVSREVAPGEIAVVTVGSVQAGTATNLIPDHAVLGLNLRSYSDQTHQRMLASVQRIVRAESHAAGSPQEPGWRENKAPRRRLDPGWALESTASHHSPPSWAASWPGSWGRPAWTR